MALVGLMLAAVNFHAGGALMLAGILMSIACLVFFACRTLYYRVHFRRHPIYYWHVHHGKLVERLYEPVRFRIDYIRACKPTDQVDTRLRLLKPVQDQSRIALLFNWPTARARLEELHAAECPDCPWNGKTIFPKVEAGP
jgi:hypothetical protein